MNDTITFSINQELLKNNLSFLYEYSSYAELLDYIVMFDKWFGIAFPGQKKLADKMGVERRTISRWLKVLEERGFLKRVSRGHRKSVIYELADWIDSSSHEVRRMFSSVLPQIKYLSVSLLSVPLKLFNNIKIAKVNYVSHILGKKGYIYKSLYSYCKRGMKMSMLVTEVIKRVPLKLTRAGQIRLMAFTDSVIEKVIRQYEVHRQRIRDPFAWFEGRCVKESAWENINPDYRFRDYLLSQYKLSMQSPVLEKKVYEKPENLNLHFKNSEVVADIYKPKTGSRSSYSVNSKSNTSGIDKQSATSYAVKKKNEWKGEDKRAVDIAAEQPKYDALRNNQRVIENLRKLGIDAQTYGGFVANEYLSTTKRNVAWKEE